VVLDQSRKFINNGPARRPVWGSMVPPESMKHVSIQALHLEIIRGFYCDVLVTRFDPIGFQLLGWGALTITSEIVVELTISDRICAL
jgi:hypothetical protein